MTIYLIPGLATDRRIFTNLSEELKDYNLIYLEHLPTLDEDETIPEYAFRLIQHQDFFDEDSIIIGLSLGGIIATEMAKIISFRKVILISTIKHYNEIPPLIRLASKLKIYLPPQLIKNTVKPISILLGVTNLTGADYISKIINDSNERHIVWAQKAVVKWNNNLIPDNYIHIHGTKDEIFPIRNVKASHRIKGGTHCMIMDRAKEIAKIIKVEI